MVLVLKGLPNRDAKTPVSGISADTKFLYSSVLRTLQMLHSVLFQSMILAAHYEFAIKAGAVSVVW